MRTRILPSTAHGKDMEATGSSSIVAIMLAASLAAVFVSAEAQTRSTTGSGTGSKDFVLTDPKDLVISGGKAETVEYQGRKAVRLTTQQQSEEVFASLKGVQIQDGTIQADIAMKTTTPPGVRMPGFVGMAFRASADASHYELFYLRPGNSRSEDQAMRNHSAQYVAAPGYDWYKLRREWPWIYESWADLKPERWSTVKIEVHGRTAKLFVSGSERTKSDRKWIERRAPAGRHRSVGLCWRRSLFLEYPSYACGAATCNKWQ